MFYHVVIETKTGSGNDIKLDLTKKQLRERILSQYENGDPIILRGKTIELSNIDQIIITRTRENSSKILPIVKAKRAKKGIGTMISDEWYVAKTGEDVTDKIILGPPGYKKSTQKSHSTREKYLDVKVLPDDFYMELQDQINLAFAYEILPAVQILSRKLVENLLVDILRKKYGTQNIDLYYDANRGRFHGFERLLKNLDERIEDFIGISSEFNKSFLKKVNKYREHGNSSAHTIELNLDKNRLENEAKDLEYAIKMLVRVLNSI